MESMIHSFRFIFLLIIGQTQSRQEAPKGELGLYIVSDNRNKVYRLKIRSGDLQNFQGLNILSHIAISEVLVRMKIFPIDIKSKLREIVNKV